MRVGVFVLILLLSGCGQRGSLYLPEEPEAEPEAVLESSDDTGETDEEEDWEETGGTSGER